MNLLLIDAIGPFFRMLPKGRKNWSKIPFSSLSLEPQARRRQHFDQIAEDLRLFARRVKQAGYNAVSLDDVPHLADHPWYEPEIRERIAIFRQEFRRLFTLLKTEGLSLYLTMDVLTLTPRLKRKRERRYSADWRK